MRVQGRGEEGEYTALRRKMDGKRIAEKGNKE